MAVELFSAPSGRSLCRPARATRAGDNLVWAEMERFGRVMGPAGLAARRAEQAVRQLSAEIEEELKARLAGAGLGGRRTALEAEVQAGRLTAPRGCAQAASARYGSHRGSVRSVPRTVHCPPRGGWGVKRSSQRISCGVRSPLRLLQRRQHATRFSQESPPPRDRGST